MKNERKMATGPRAKTKGEKTRKARHGIFRLTPAVGLLLLLVSPSAHAISGPPGTTVTLGTNWIQFKQGRESFSRYSDFGARGHAKNGQIRGGCLVFGPYVDLPHRGHVKAWLDLEVLVGMHEYMNFRRFPPRARFNGDTPLFTVDLTANHGERIIAKRVVRFKDMRKWEGRGTRYSRCTASDPCTAGLAPISRQTFYVYTDNDASDIIGGRLSGPMDDVELRVCEVNTNLTKISIRSTTIELTY